jgi:hypothetical protein
MIVEGNADLLEIVRTRRATGRFASGLDRGQEQGHQDANDGDDN